MISFKIRCSGIYQRINTFKDARAIVVFDVYSTTNSCVYRYTHSKPSHSSIRQSKVEDRRAVKDELDTCRDHILDTSIAISLSEISK